MERTQCLNPAELKEFVSRLDSSMVTISEDTLTINATNGAIDWIYVEVVNLFCVGGDYIGLLGGILA